MKTAVSATLVACLGVSLMLTVLGLAYLSEWLTEFEQTIIIGEKPVSGKYGKRPAAESVGG